MDGCYFVDNRNDLKDAPRHGGVSLFQKKEVIYSETLGVCIVDDIVKLSDSQKESYNYYLLRAVSDRTKKAYIPVDNHSVQLRNLITLQEAVALREAADFAERSVQVRGEAAYVIEQAQTPRSKKQVKEQKLSENSENNVQNN